MTSDAGQLAGAVVVVTGAGGAAGQATVAQLLTDGATVIAADVSESALAALVADAGSQADLHTASVDLLDEEATRDWAATLEIDHGHVDGVVHLVGGWRGGKKFSDNTSADWDFLHKLLIRTVQTTTLAFHDPLLRAYSHGHGGRFVLVSAQAAAAPTAGNAGYAAAKSAAEAWTIALADSFSKAEERNTDANTHQHTAAIVLVIKALLTPAMRADKPDAAFAGFTAVNDLARRIAALFADDAALVNGTRINL